MPKNTPKKIDPDELLGASIFRDNHLTELMIDTLKGKNHLKQSISYPIYLLLKELLEPYGISLGGGVRIGDYEVKAVTIGKDFPIENEYILKQLYGFTGDDSVNIQLAKTKDEECAYAFDYNLNDYTCTFQKWVFGSLKEKIEYDSLGELLKEARF